MTTRPWIYFAAAGALFTATIGAAAFGMGYFPGLPGVAAIFLVAGIVRLSYPDRPGGKRENTEEAVPPNAPEPHSDES